MVLLSKKQKKLKTLKYKNILLLGMMASGKTSLALEISKLTGLAFVDLDSLILNNSKHQSINSIFKNFGEKYFRRLETKTLKKILKKYNQVVSLGGGAMLTPLNQDLIQNNKECITVWLDTDFELIYKRLQKLTDRPIFNNITSKNEFLELYKLRSKEYKKAKIKIVNTSINELKPSELAIEAVRLIENYAEN